MNVLSRWKNFILKVVLPGLLTCAASAFVMHVCWMFAKDHVPLKIFRLFFGQYLELAILCPLCLLSICGALGAFLSKCNGGSRPQRIAAALFPSEIMGFLYLLLLVHDFMLSLFLPGYWPNTAAVLKEFGLRLSEFVILPAVFLMLGAGVAEKIGKASSQTPCNV